MLAVSHSLSIHTEKQIVAAGAPGCSLLGPSRGLYIATYLVTHWKLLAGRQEVGLRRRVCTTGENPDLRHTGVIKKGLIHNIEAKAGRKSVREAWREFI